MVTSSQMMIWKVAAGRDTKMTDLAVSRVVLRNMNKLDQYSYW